MSSVARRLSVIRNEREKQERPTNSKINRAKADVVKSGRQLVWGTAAVSSVLNMVANSHAAKSADMLTWALSVALGAAIPLVVLWLGKVSSSCYKARMHVLSQVVGAVGCAVLLLSVVHVSSAVALLTGGEQPSLGCTLLAYLLAIGVDCGLVATEVAVVCAEE